MRITFPRESIKLPKKHTEIGETKTPRHTPNLYSLGLNFRLFLGLFFTDSANSGLSFDM
jgi:hypothetical protein